MPLRNRALAGLFSVVFLATPALAESGDNFNWQMLQQRRVDAVKTASTADAKQDKKAGKKSTQSIEKTTVKSKTERKLVEAKATDKVQAKVIPISTAPTSDVAREGNNGELRSVEKPNSGFFKTIFGNDAPQYLPETKALDNVLASRAAAKKFTVKPELEPQSVAFSGYERGTVVVDTATRHLYLVESSDTARRYSIAVGREGLAFKGTTTVGDKQEWPRWFPTKDMQEREPKKYGRYKDGMNGGPDNPLGARAIYLYQGNKDTYIRIHGTNQPQTIGSASSNGCFRMINDHVMDLYRRIPVGAQVVVL